MPLRPSTYLAAAGLLTLFAASAHAQAPVRPFDRLDVGLYGAATISDNSFNSYWDAGASGAVDFVTPFYVGRASLLVRVGTDAAVPGAATSGFTSVFGALGLRVGRPLREHLRADVGLHVGFTEWIFNSEDDSSIRYELELGTEASVRLAYEFAARWHAVVEASYQRTFTYERIDLGFVSIGLARSFGAPGWIRGVLE